MPRAPRGAKGSHTTTMPDTTPADIAHRAGGGPRPSCSAAVGTCPVSSGEVAASLLEDQFCGEGS